MLDKGDDMLYNIVREAKPMRRRKKISITISKEVAEILDGLSKCLNAPRGRIIDKLVLTLMATMETQKMHCINGSPCEYGKPFRTKDLIIL